MNKVLQRDRLYQYISRSKHVCTTDHLSRCDIFGKLIWPVLVEQEQPGSDHIYTSVLRKCLDALTHLVVLTRAEQNGWHEMAAKAATSLLRFLEPVQVGASEVVLVPADKAFYLAGCAWKKVRYCSPLLHTVAIHMLPWCFITCAICTVTVQNVPTVSTWQVSSS